MKVLKAGSSGLYSTLGQQTEEAGIEYDYHKYLIRYEDVIYNSFTGEVVRVEDEENDRRELISKWFMIPKDLDPRGLSYLSRENRISKSKTITTVNRYTIFTTVKCNAACEYCFQHGGIDASMSRETANGVATYILNNSSRLEPIKITWFGGEPLVNREPINVICTRLRNQNVPYQSEMSSNGYLFDKVSDGEVYLWNLKKVQFTADLPGDAYDKMKGLPSGAYEKLKETAKRFENLSVLAQIRVHYHPEFGLDVAKQIVDDFKGYKRVSMYPAMIYDEHRTKEDYDNLLKLEDYMIESGVLRYVPSSPGRPVYCMGDNPSSRCIRVDGTFTTCEHFYEGNTIGSITATETDYDLLHEWQRKRKHEIKCYDCPLFPACELLANCPSIGKCEDGYGYFRVEEIRNALRRYK